MKCRISTIDKLCSIDISYMIENMTQSRTYTHVFQTTYVTPILETLCGY